MWKRGVISHKVGVWGDVYHQLGPKCNKGSVIIAENLNESTTHVDMNDIDV